MCGLCYQWLKSDLSVDSQPGELRTGELMLLRVGVIHLPCALISIYTHVYVHVHVGDMKNSANCMVSSVAQLKEHRPKFWFKSHLAACFVLLS